ncbi:preprotein translocase subunit YajC [Aliiroseovarius marinus]|uniref:preprotein translocase subunit YajC n=1 Tax=Aliiroseovarius marinus TaxID=2500159 RepID=UPI003D7C7C91
MFVTPAFAQAAGAPQGGIFSSMLVPMLLVFGIMYFFMIRPQQKKMKEHQAMLEAVRKGDQIVTQGGVIGKITKVKDDTEVEVEIATGVKVRVVRATIVKVMGKTEPVEG